MPFKKQLLGLLSLGLLASWLMTPLAQAVTFEETGAPEELGKWREWVLYGRENDFCPAAATNSNNKLCDWPVSLELDLDEKGGRFRISYQVFAETFVNLPGGPNQWPREAVIEETGQRLPIVRAENRPQVFLKPGRWTVGGRFAWVSLPETLTVPREAGLTVLRIDGRPVDFPRLENAGLWLKEKAVVSPPEADSKGEMRVERSRLINDDIPLRVITHLRLSISGSPREEAVADVLLAGAAPMKITSQLPARFAEDGSLRIQARPGTWEVIVEARMAGPVDQLAAPEGQDQPAEPWAFQAQNHLRQVEISGPARIDANQTNIYKAWKQFPVYDVQPGEIVHFKTIRRGDPDPAPDNLALFRRCWLDAKGSGLTCRDNIKGTLSRQWHLNTSAPFSLGQAAVGGVDQLITWQTDSKGQKAPGVQLRQGQLNLEADLRLDGFKGLLPASGWDHDFTEVRTNLMLPAGYKIFYLSGAKAQLQQNYRHNSIPAAWVERWRTLDLFFVLLITIGVFALYGPKWSVLAFFALLLSYHEAEAPRLVFLHLLAAAALLKVLPEGCLRKLVLTWRLVASLILVVMAVPFFIHQVRVAVYPQLEDFQDDVRGYVRGYNFSLGEFDGNRFSHSMAENYDPDEHEPRAAVIEPRASAFDLEETAELKSDEILDEAAQIKGFIGKGQPRPESSQKSLKPDQSLSVMINQAPEAILQNGPGRPQWSWRSVDLIFSGQVVKEQNVRIRLITPRINSLLNVARVLMMIPLSFVLLGFGRFKSIAAPQPKTPNPPKTTAAAAVALAGLLSAACLLNAAPAAAQNSGPEPGGRPAPPQAMYAYPSQQMLNELAERLLKEETVPAPAWPKLTIAADPRTLTLILEVETAQRAAVPLPQLNELAFSLQSVTLSGREKAPPVLRDRNGRLYALVPEGVHTLTMAGRLRNVDGLQLNFLADALPQQVAADLRGWRIDGLDEWGHLISASVYLSKEAPDSAAEENAGRPAAEKTGPDDGETFDDDKMKADLPAFFMVKRTVSLGLEWKVHTQVVRLTADNRQDSLRLPLLPGEKPVGNLAVNNGLITLNFANNASVIQWESALRPAGQPDDALTLELKAAEGPYVETWIVDASPIWRVRPKGPPPISQLGAYGFWQPQWRPWAGETLALTIDRPTPAPGVTLVIDSAELTVNVGDQMNRYILDAAIRSSQGGPYSFKTPEGASVQSLTLQGRRLAYSQDGNVLTVPLTPGSQRLKVEWVAAAGKGLITKTPGLDLSALVPEGLMTANLKLNINMPTDRWILGVSGPMMGPAVLLWSYLAVLALFAVILGRTRLTPLKTHTWLLLALGLTQLSALWALVIVGWLLALGVRAKRPLKNWFVFDAAQIGLLIWSALALFLLYQGVKAGLMGLPDMQISGNGSTDFNLRWFQDRVDGPLPQGVVYSAPLMAYRGVTLVWSLWLAIALISWLKWGWQALNQNGLWKSMPPRARHLPKALKRAQAGGEKSQTPPEAKETPSNPQPDSGGPPEKEK